ncbi:MAG TPA: fatty acyl-AMP ligase [Gemmataceae bacterium]|jgi:acyl-CoA synthetase (AMP-forming)/AMP-acid ligase II
MVLPSNPPVSAVSIVEVLRAWADTTPDSLAFSFLTDAGEEGARLTYGDLDLQARAIAATLRDAAETGDRALLMYPPGLEFIAAFLGCLAAGIIAVPAYPPRRNRKDERLRAIVKDAKPRLILTSRQVLPTIETSELGNVNDSVSLATDAIEVGTDDNRPLPNIAGDRAAFLQYTSGSTGTPRGVIVTHDNLMANERAIQTAFRQTPDCVVVGWLPVFHDMGLIGNVLQPLHVGYSAVLLSPISFLREPVRWLQAISEYRGTTAGAPNFAYDLCVRGITEEQKQGLDLHSWTVAYNGAEPVWAETLDRFAEAFGGCGFRRAAFFPCYGLAEATLFVSGSPAIEEPRRHCVDPSALEGGGQAVAAEPPAGRWLVSSGRPAEGTKVLAVDPTTRMAVPERRVGELWVSSPSVAAGYWERDEETRTTFGNYLASGEGPFLSTGDLGFLDGGEVFVTGRLKDLIIIRGRNHYPQDIEQTAQSVHPSLRGGCGAAFETYKDGQPMLVIVQEIERRGRDLDAARLLGDVRQAVGRRHELHVHDLVLLEPGSLPKTSSGKVQRYRCRLDYEQGTLRQWKRAKS